MKTDEGLIDEKSRAAFLPPYLLFYWSGGLDSNQRPLDPQSNNTTRISADIPRSTPIFPNLRPAETFEKTGGDG